MDTFKKIGNRIKVILTQLIAFIVSFFKNEKQEPKVLKAEEENNTVKKEENKEKIIVTSDSTPLPDEPDTKSDDHLSYKQSISTINKDMKEEIKNRVQSKEIYFSEIVIINTIIDVIEEKNDFKFAELSDSKKEKIKKEVDNINAKITPSIKKEMLNNKIKTKEELKDTISKKISNLHYNYNPIKNIIKEEAPIIEEKEEEKPKIVIEDKELNIKPIKNKKKLITISPTDNKSEFITIKKRDKEFSKEDRVYFIADLLPDMQDNLNLRKDIKIDTQKDLISDTKKDTAIAMKIKSKKLPFMMIPTTDTGKAPAIERIRNATVDTSIIAKSKTEDDNKYSDSEEKEKVEEYGTPIKTLYKSEEDNISPEEKKIADIAVDREILNEIKDDIQKQQKILNPFMISTSNSKEEDTKEKIESIKDKEKIKEETIEIKEEKEDILDNLQKDKKEIIAELDKLTEEITKIEETNEELKKEIEEIEEIEEEKKPEEKTKEEAQEEVQKEINLEIKPDSKEEKILPSPFIEEEEPEIQPIKEEKEEVQEEPKETIKEEKVQVLPIIEVEEKIEEKKDNIEIKNIHRNTESTIIATNNEIKKEELEDKDYEKYEKMIEDLLYDIEMYKIKNEDSLTPSDREKLNQEKNKLKTLKNKLETQKEKDIEKEKKELEAELTQEEIEGIQAEIKQLHLDHQEEVNEELIAKLKKMEETNDSKMAEIEQQLIKSKLKKAARAAELPSILALPFIRHRYFFYFTIGLFVNNHFNFLNALFKRKVVKYEPIDLTAIKNGYDALDSAIDKTYENIVYLDYLENEAITKYPSLKEDKEFNKYITKIRTKLNSNYEKLQNKQKMINKYIKKINKKNSVYKKYKLVKEDKAA